MPETSKEAAASSPSPAPKKPGFKIVIVVIAVVLCLAGGYWFMTHRALASSKRPAKVPAKIKKGDAAPVATLRLDTFVVNLADADHNSFLRVDITLGLDKPMPQASEGAKDSPLTPEIRDAILDALTTWPSSDLLAVGGKTKLKAQLLTVLQKRIPQLGVVDIYFTDFLIQQ
ncbi:MAG: flagellar basal body-associated FliL family protein [Terriglobia bacterium]